MRLLPLCCIGSLALACSGENSGDDQPPPNGCLQLAAPIDGSASALMGRPVGDQFADLFDGDQIPVDFPVQGGQFLTLWGRFYTPSGVDHWWTHLDLIHKDSREELGSVDWYVTPCEGGWADVYLRLEVQPTAEGPCQMTVQHELFDASENVLGTIEDEVDVEVLNSMSGGS